MISAINQKKEQKNTHEILLRAVFAGEPQSIADRRPQIIVVLLEEARRPIRIAATGERVIVPPVEQDGGGLWHVDHVGVHGVQNVHQLRLDFGISQRLNTLRPVAL